MYEMVEKDTQIKDHIKRHQWLPASKLLAVHLLQAFYAYPAPAETVEQFHIRKNAYPVQSAKKLQRRLVDETSEQLEERRAPIANVSTY